MKENPFLGEDLWEKIIISIDTKRQYIHNIFIKENNKINHWKYILSSKKDIKEQLHEHINREIIIEDAFLNTIFKISEEEDDKQDDNDDDEKADFWKYNHEDYILTNYGNIENLTTFRQAFSLAIITIRWTKSNYVNYNVVPTSTYTCINHILCILTHISSGYHFGFDPEFLGANIVHNKIALNICNKALSMLGQAIEKQQIKRTIIQKFYNLLFELRNDIAIYIQRLRRKHFPIL